jgi:phosphoglycerate dehydrogenase-like enzyme
VTPRPVAVAARPLAEDFDLTNDASRVLALLELLTPDQGPGALADAEVLITSFTKQTASPIELAAGMPRLRWIHSMFAGVEGLLSDALLERRILVTSGAGAYANAMAEYTLAWLVMLMRSLPELVLAQAERRWASPHPLGAELAGKRLGIVGYGGIGRAVAGLCACAGMSVWGVRRRPDKAADGAAERVLPFDRLHELLAASDAVVLAASLNPTTRGLIGADEFASMKQGAVFVNLSRGALVDEAALVASLRSGRLAGAVVDVTSEEPLPPSSELWDVPNLHVTPHMSGGTIDSRRRALGVLLTNIELFVAGRLDQLVNVVDLSFELRAAVA